MLGDLYDFPKDVYPVGRLDKDSEGLLILTNDARLNARLLTPGKGHTRTYLVQVEGIPGEKALEKLRTGVDIRINKRTYRTRPGKATLLSHPPGLPERDPPIRFRKSVPDSWIELTLTEGKNRQVRRMCAAVGFPVLRLVRTRIEDLALEDLQPGKVQGYKQKELYQKLRIEPL